MKSRHYTRTNRYRKTREGGDSCHSAEMRRDLHDSTALKLELTGMVGTQSAIRGNTADTNEGQERRSSPAEDNPMKNPADNFNFVTAAGDLIAGQIKSIRGAGYRKRMVKSLHCRNKTIGLKKALCTKAKIWAPEVPKYPGKPPEKIRPLPGKARRNTKKPKRGEGVRHSVLTLVNVEGGGSPFNGIPGRWSYVQQKKVEMGKKRQRDRSLHSREIRQQSLESSSSWKGIYCVQNVVCHHAHYRSKNSKTKQTAASTSLKYQVRKVTVNIWNAKNTPEQECSYEKEQRNLVWGHARQKDRQNNGNTRTRIHNPCTEFPNKRKGIEKRRGESEQLIPERKRPS